MGDKSPRDREKKKKRAEKKKGVHKIATVATVSVEKEKKSK